MLDFFWEVKCFHYQGPFVQSIVYCLKIEADLACAGLNSAHVEV